LTPLGNSTKKLVLGGVTESVDASEVSQATQARNIRYTVSDGRCTMAGALHGPSFFVLG
jgi:hypothetical protein